MLQLFREYNPVAKLLVFVAMFILLLVMVSFLEIALVSLCWNVPFKDVSIFLETNAAASRFLQALTQIGIFALPAFLFCALFQGNAANYFQFKSVKSGGFLALAMLFIALFSSPFIGWLQQWNNGLTFPTALSEYESAIRAIAAKNEQLVLQFMNSTSWSILLLNLFVMAVVPAFCEEIFFRGVLQQLLIQISGKKHIAIVLTAIIFTLFHFEPFSFFPRFVISLVLGYLFYYSRSIWVSMLFHFIHNGLLVVLYFLYLRGTITLNLTDESLHFDWWVILLSAILTSGLLYVVFKKVKNKQISSQ